MTARMATHMHSAAALLATLLITLGIVLDQTWGGETAAPLVWGTLALLVMLLPFHDPACAAATRYCRIQLANPWLWLTLAIGCGTLVLIVGSEHYGALRHYGNALPLRASLWALAAFIVFLALFAQQPAPGLFQQAAAALGSAVVALSFFLQPDLHGLLLLGAVSLLIASQARHGLRLWMPAAVLAGLAALLAYIVVTPYRLQRTLRYFTARADDPFGIGMEARLLEQASAQGGWLGFAGNPSESALARLPAILEWYAPAYLALWGGLLAVVLCAVALCAYGLLVWALAQDKASTQRLIVHAGLLACTLTTAWAFLAYGLNWVPGGAGFGIPFLAGGQSGVAAGSLLLLAACRSGSQSRHTSTRG